MSRDIREHLEGIAMDIKVYKGDSRADARKQVQELSDAELVEFIVK